MWTVEKIKLSIRDVFTDAVMHSDQTIEVSYRLPSWNTSSSIIFRPGTVEHRNFLQAAGPMKPGQTLEFWAERLISELPDANKKILAALKNAFDLGQVAEVKMLADKSIVLRLAPDGNMEMKYSPNSIEYSAVLERTGPLNPGDVWTP